MKLKTTLQALIGTGLLLGLTATAPAQMLINPSPAKSGSSIGRLQIDAVWKF